MQLFLNLLIILAIVIWATMIIIRTFRKVQVGGRCAACNYDCTVKKLKKQHDQSLLKR